MNPTKTIEQYRTLEPAPAGEETEVPPALEPPTEELRIISGDVHERAQILAEYITGGYLSEHFDLIPDNPVHKELYDILAAQGKLRGEPKFSALPIKMPSSEVSEA